MMSRELFVLVYEARIANLEAAFVKTLTEAKSLREPTDKLEQKLEFRI